MTRLAVFALALLASACDTDFEPTLPDDRAFSMSGALDAAADTQWVRVEPFRDTFDGIEGPIDATVTLEGPGGATATLTQEVRTFPNGPAHLFWTTAPIAQGATYRIVARTAEGAESRAVVEVPVLSEDVRINVSDRVSIGPPPCPIGAEAVGYGPLYVAGVEMLYTVRGPSDAALRRVRVPQSPVVRDAARTSVGLYFGDDAPRLRVSAPSPVRVEGTVRFAFATEAWPRFDSLEEVLLWAGDVENGLGFVGGVVTVEAPVLLSGGVVPTAGDPVPDQPCRSSR